MMTPPDRDVVMIMPRVSSLRSIFDRVWISMKRNIKATMNLLREYVEPEARALSHLSLTHQQMEPPRNTSSTTLARGGHASRMSNDNFWWSTLERSLIAYPPRLEGAKAKPWKDKVMYASLFRLIHGLADALKLGNISECLYIILNNSEPWLMSSEVELTDMMVRLRIARGCTRIGCIYLYDIIKLYACKTDYSGIAHDIVQEIDTGGSIEVHSEHAWTTCFLVFKFSIDPSIVDLSVQDMVSFIKQIVLLLAMHDLKAFSQYTSALELLWLATENLEAMEDSFLSEGDNSYNKSAVQIAPNIYYEFAHVRATLLESRAKLMIRDGLYDIGEQLYRKALNIKEVICG
ncbi:hypothetical protein J5N97_000422 [Dioscorea zingiberensis]|uniref:Plant disease resistance WDH domain-containing protein n=1 Tax=Dioscorea zingiberensis TaxID=325984 RepID=A0A9D5BVE9_9LILI|nr:hypothetical protein J5N97_000422 [Dioscorea zingiberensis]